MFTTKNQKKIGAESIKLYNNLKIHQSLNYMTSREY